MVCSGFDPGAAVCCVQTKPRSKGNGIKIDQFLRSNCFQFLVDTPKMSPYYSLCHKFCKKVECFVTP